MTVKAKPFIKWIGGKRQLMDVIQNNLPKEFNRYYEPFIGGGALLFELSLEDAVINDYNSELINLYRVIQTNPQDLITDLYKHQNNSEYYYSIRNLDRDIETFAKMSNVERASRFIYLNRTGFNGLYRVNSKNQNNVAFASYPNPKIVDEENILACSKLLKATTILEGDFENIKPLIEKGDFVYLDPPYVPLTETSNFVSYTDQGFDNEMQIRVKNLCDYINDIGAYFMASNSSADFILDLYKDYNVMLVNANRSLNCKGDKRGSVKEVLITNYKTSK